MTDQSIYDIRKTIHAYDMMLESAELDALKLRLNEVPMQIIKRSFSEMSKHEKADALKKGGMVETLGASSRIAMLTPDGTVLKIANNEAGLAQNHAEIMNYAEKNAYGCFAKVLWFSRNHFALEMEYARNMEGSDVEFEEITGINLDKYYNYLKYERIRKLTPKKRDAYHRAKYYSYAKNPSWEYNSLDSIRVDHDEVASELRIADADDEPKNVLKNLAMYLETHTSMQDFSYIDAVQSDNWGVVVRNDQEVCVIIDHGASDEVLYRHYFNVSPTSFQNDEQYWSNRRRHQQ